MKLQLTILKNKIGKLVFYLLIAMLCILSFATIAESANRKKGNEDLEEFGKEVLKKGVEIGIDTYKKSNKEHIIKPEVCENNIIKNSDLTCIVNKQKGTNKVYLEIIGKQSLWDSWGKTSVPEKDDLPDINIKVRFEMKNKIYTHDLLKRDWDIFGSFHLYWDINYKDVDFDNTISVTLTGTVNPKTKRTEELSIGDYSNSNSWFGPSRREADDEAYGVVKSKGLFGSWF